MNRMYERAIVSMEIAKTLYAKSDGDDAYMDAACFQTQQAVEFILKAALIDRGIEYPKTHDIEGLNSLLTGSGFTYPMSDTVNDLSTTLTTWEAGSRYGQGIRTGVTTMRKVKESFDSIVEAYLKEQEKNQEQKDPDINTDDHEDIGDD